MSGQKGGSRAYEALLRAYPRAFRARFGEGLRYAFERDREQAQGRGAVALAGFWARTVVWTVGSGLLERTGTGLRALVRAVDGGTREVRHAGRRLARRPGFAATAVVTLAVGVGATTAIFSVIDGVVLRPLPYEAPEQLVRVGHLSPTDALGMPAGGFLHYADRSRTLSEIALYLEQSVSIAGTGSPLELGVIQASRQLLPLLGVEPVLGRGFREEDFAPGASPVAVVTHGFWTRQLGADPAALGRPLLEGEDEVVVGVLPAGFEFLRPDAIVVFGNRFDAPDVFIPMADPDPARSRFGNFMYQSLARLAPGATATSAQAELNVLMHEAAERFPGGFTPAELQAGGYRATVTRVQDALVGDVARVLWLLLGAVAVVLLIAAANVANLLLIRAESRHGELAVRRALGASRSSLATSFLSESVLLALAGGAVGVVVGVAGMRGLLGMVPGDVPRLDEVGLNGRVLAFSFALSAVTGLAAGLLPLLRSRRGDLRAALSEESRGGTAGRERLRARQALVAGQVALALVLLAGSALLLRTFQNLRAVDPGFDAGETLTMRLALSGPIVRAAGRTEAGDLARSRFMLELTDRLAALPGVERVAFAADLPLDGDEWHDFVTTEEAFAGDMTPELKAARVFVGPGYLAAIGARMVAGRELDRSDFADQPRAVVVNEAFARQRWPDQDPVGRRIAQYFRGLDRDADVWYTVVGVVADIREVSLMQAPEPTVYLPTAFLPEGDFAMWVSNFVAIARTSGDALAQLPAVRAAIREFRPDVPVNSVITLDGLVARSYQDVRFVMVLLLLAAGVSVLLGVVGIYGAVAYVVGQRTREFALRIALGASAWEVLRGVVGVSLGVGMAGIAAGLVTALAGGRVMRSLLFGVRPDDPLVYASVAGILLAVVIVASVIPARRAAGTDPARALRGS